jgi:undecaprenyl-diphosphatase
MEIFLIFKAIILGVIEGLTEFLPVSSTGHLIIASEFLGFNSIPNKLFEIVIQLGAILAICVIYRQKLFGVVCSLNKDKNSWKFSLNILIAFMPALIIGFFAHDYIKKVLFDPLIIAYALIVGGVIMIAIDHVSLKKTYHEIEEFSFPMALKIGFCQIIAMVPGVSRSGSTIIGAMIFGASKKSAAEFSFFLAIPTILAASVYDLFKARNDLTFDHLSLVAIGFIAAFISALIVVKTFIAVIRNYGFSIFGYYRIILGIFLLFILC